MSCFWAYALALTESRAATAAMMTSGWDVAGWMIAAGLVMMMMVRESGEGRVVLMRAWVLLTLCWRHRRGLPGAHRGVLVEAWVGRTLCRYV